jgi:hypothetical protein
LDSSYHAIRSPIYFGEWKGDGVFFLLSWRPSTGSLVTALFCIAKEVLSRALSMACNAGKIVPMSYYRGVSLLTHILYADDVLIFCAGTKQDIRCLLKFFNDYYAVFGQIINNSKIRFYSGAMTTSHSQMIAVMLGFSAGTIPFIYLGCPILETEGCLFSVNYRQN